MERALEVLNRFSFIYWWFRLLDGTIYQFHISLRYCVLWNGNWYFRQIDNGLKVFKRRHNQKNTCGVDVESHIIVFNFQTHIMYANVVSYYFIWQCYILLAAYRTQNFVWYIRWEQSSYKKSFVYILSAKK